MPVAVREEMMCRGTWPQSAAKAAGCVQGLVCSSEAAGRARQEDKSAEEMAVHT